ncbi:MAG: T9SS type A sorting domain-containing protein [bacterium]
MKSTPVIFLTLLGLSVPAAAHNITIESAEVPLVIDTYGKYRQNQSLFYWTPFDSTLQVWDLTRYPTPLRAKAGLRDYTEGRYPAPDTMENDPPAPDVCEFDTTGNNAESEVYLYLNDNGLYIDGLDMTQQGFRFIGNYRPDGVVYNLPMYYGGSWISAWSWQYEIIPGIPYQATEQHQKRIVARGKVKIPMSGEYFWPCLVIKDYMVYNDNMGTNERRWIYEWVVPGHFCGGNGVAAALSQNGAAPDFVTVETFMQLDTLIIPDWDLFPPRFGATTILTDTTYPGPFIVSSTITDNDAVGAESLFYRINQGAWVSVPSDSQRSNIYYFTIPQVTQPARIDYYIWAMDEFCVDNEIEFWTTFPFCSPESTMITFNVTTTGFEELHHLLPAETQLTITPNPFTTSTVFQLQHPFAKAATLLLYRADGTLLQKLILNQQANGLLATTWHRGRLSAGVYFYHCSAPGFSETGKITISK